MTPESTVSQDTIEGIARTLGLSVEQVLKCREQLARINLIEDRMEPEDCALTTYTIKSGQSDNGQVVGYVAELDAGRKTYVVEIGEGSDHLDPLIELTQIKQVDGKETDITIRKSDLATLIDAVMAYRETYSEQATR